MFIRPRTANFLIAGFCIVALAIAMYMQLHMGLQPCPLCISQRICMAFIGLVALIGALHGPGAVGTRIYASLTLLGAIAGGGVAARQVWLQSLPPGQAPSCGPSLSYILQTFPLDRALTLMLKGDGNCAEVVWRFLGLSIPGWTLIAFAGLALASMWLLLQRSQAVTYAA